MVVKIDPERMDTSVVQAGTATVEGAELYYEVRGDGPPVLIIQGGLSEAGATEQLADALATHYRVICYDRRGLSRSHVVSGTPPVAMTRHAEDASALLSTLCTEPALVVGASIGALIALHLAVLYPSTVEAVVAHEPPMSTVVADPEREAALDDIAALAQKDVTTAIQQMASLTGVTKETPEPGARPGRPAGDFTANLRWFFANDFPAVRSSTIDSVDVMRATKSTPIIPTGGLDSRGRWEYRCAQKLAQDLGRELTEMPGGHNGLVSHPWATASELQRLFSQAGTDAT